MIVLLTILLTNTNLIFPKIISTLIHINLFKIAIFEGINNKLKLLRCSGLGFRNFNNFERELYFFDIFL
ncbi:transposase [Microcoleus sp. BROC3]|uniref:transposase n=1 Tax=Microcoleus sp. BROC3 TaxID=3055323 RepID=UPI002FCFFECF